MLLLYPNVDIFSVWVYNQSESTLAFEKFFMFYGFLYKDKINSAWVYIIEKQNLPLSLIISINGFIVKNIDN